MAAQRPKLHIGAWPFAMDFGDDSDSIFYNASLVTRGAGSYALNSGAYVLMPSIGYCFIYDPMMRIVAAMDNTVDYQEHPILYHTLDGSELHGTQDHDPNAQASWAVLQQLNDAFPVTIPREQGSFDPATIAILDRLAEIQQSLNSLNSGEVTALSLDGPQKEYMTDVDPQTPQTVSLRIPAAKICPDAILSWPILRDVRLQTSLNSLTLADHDHGVEEVASSDLNLALIPGLIDRFLQFVHVKNPVVDTVALRQSAVTVEVGESSRNSHSCLVIGTGTSVPTATLRIILKFLACALGCLAGPLRYDDLSVERDDHAESRHTTGEQFYRKALESISLPGDRILTAQCWFLSGVYQMYKLNAARAWMDFSRASAALSLHLRHREAASNEDEEAKRFMRKAIECSFHLISSKATQHRHHGTWFVARGVLSSALLIIAAIKADKGLVDYLADWPDLLDQAIRSLSHWASEARDLAYAVVVLANLKQKLCL
nr:hypothetical protein ANI_1_1850144 [Aspergillus niger CBS 513.88]|eukprot:XP_001397924.2 hypothetical protein ANI_1_1850144 [Aspergillus niger CBS 513.88]